MGTWGREDKFLPFFFQGWVGDGEVGSFTSRLLWSDLRTLCKGTCVTEWPSASQTQKNRSILSQVYQWPLKTHFYWIILGKINGKNRENFGVQANIQAWNEKLTPDQELIDQKWNKESGFISQSWQHPFQGTWDKGGGEHHTNSFTSFFCCLVGLSGYWIFC